MMYRQKGLSLIELMISLTLGIVLMTGVVQMFLTSRATYGTQQAISRIQESGRMAADFLAQDIRMAGYMGCASSNAEITHGLDPSPDYKYEFDVGIQGYSAADAPAEIVAADGTEVIVVRRASGEGVPIVERHEENSNANFKVDGEVSNKCLLDGQFCEKEVGVITDCTKGRVFRAVTISNSGGSNPTVSHSQGGGSSLPGNLDNTLGGQGFGEGSQIMAVNTIVYYIADSAFSPDGVVQVRSLWKKVGEKDPVELVEGVEDIRVRYGIDDDGGTVKVPNAYKTVSEMTAADNWNEAQAVRLHLLLQGAQDNVLPDSQTLDFAGEAITFSDGRMRQVFTSTVGIRSRLN